MGPSSRASTNWGGEGASRINVSATFAKLDTDGGSLGLLDSDNHAKYKSSDLIT